MPRRWANLTPLSALRALVREIAVNDDSMVDRSGIRAQPTPLSMPGPPLLAAYFMAGYRPFDMRSPAGCCMRSDY